MLFTYISWYLLWKFPIYIYLDICLLYNVIFINIGYTMKPRGLRDLDTRGNLYKHPRAKRKGVYGFQGDLNPVGPEGFIV